MIRCRFLARRFLRRNQLIAAGLGQQAAPYRSAGCDNGPLMMGACSGVGSGAGIRLWKAGICGLGSAKTEAGVRPKPPRPAPCARPGPCAKPPRAKLGVDPTTQVTANTAAKRRCMVVFLT